MMRIINEGKEVRIPMNSSSDVITSLLMKAMRVELALRDLRTESIENVCDKLLEIPYEDMNEVRHIVSKIFDEAGQNHELIEKYGQFASRTFTLVPSVILKNRFTHPTNEAAYGMFQHSCMGELFGLLKNRKPTEELGMKRKLGVAKFLAHLYFIGIFEAKIIDYSLALMEKDIKTNKYLRIFLKAIVPNVLKNLKLDEEMSIELRANISLFKILTELEFVNEPEIMAKIKALPKYDAGGSSASKNSNSKKLEIKNKNSNPAIESKEVKKKKKNQPKKEENSASGSKNIQQTVASIREFLIDSGDDSDQSIYDDALNKITKDLEAGLEVVEVVEITNLPNKKQITKKEFTTKPSSSKTKTDSGDDKNSSQNSSEPKEEVKDSEDAGKAAKDEKASSVPSSSNTSKAEPTSSTAENSKPSKKEGNRSRSPSTSSNSSTSSDTTDMSINIVALFQEHLKLLKEKKPTKFDFELFCKSTDDENQTCADLLMQSAMTDPAQCKVYVDVVTSIRNLSIPAKSKEKNFNDAFTDICDKEMDKLLENIAEDKAYFVRLENFGLFAAELYLIDAIQLSIFYKWVDTTKFLAKGNLLSVKVWVNVFQIFYKTIVKRDNKKFNEIFEYMEQYGVPLESRRLYNKIMRECNELRKQGDQGSSSTLKNKTGIAKETTEKASKDVSPTTGAVKKDQNNSATQTCSMFKNFLDSAKTTDSIFYAEFRMDESSSAALQGCALIFIEQCVDDPDKAALYTKVLKDHVIALFKTEKAKDSFKNYLKNHILVQMDKTVKVDRPTATNWTRVASFSCFLCELYQVGLLDYSVYEVWIGKLREASKCEMPEAMREYEASLVLGSTVTRRRKEEEKMKAAKEEARRKGKKFDESKFKPENDVRKVIQQAMKDEKLRIEKEKRAKTKKSIKTGKPLYYVPRAADPDVTTPEMIVFSEMMCNLHDYDTGMVIHMFNRIPVETENDFESFLRFYFNLCMDSYYPTGLARIAKLLCAELQPFDFKERISRMICSYFNEATYCFRERTDEDDSLVDKIVLVFSEFYNYDVIGFHNYFACIEKFVDEDFKSPTQIHVFSTILFITANKLINTGCGVDIRKIYKVLRYKKDHMKLTIKSRSFARLMDFLIAIIQNSSKVIEESEKKLTFDILMENLNESNFKNAVKLVERMNVFKEYINCGVFYRKCVAHMDRLELYCKFIKEVCVVKEDLKDFVLGCLVIEFGQKLGFGSSTMEAKKLKKEDVPKLKRVIKIVMGLLDIDFVSLAFMDVFLQFITSDICENRFLCAGFILKAIGPRAEKERPKLIEDAMERLQKNLNEPMLMFLFMSLVQLRDSKWTDDDTMFGNIYDIQLKFDDDDQIKVRGYNKMMFKFDDAPKIRKKKVAYPEPEKSVSKKEPEKPTYKKVQALDPDVFDPRHDDHEIEESKFVCHHSDGKPCGILKQIVASMKKERQQEKAKANALLNKDKKSIKSVETEKISNKSEKKIPISDTTSKKPEKVIEKVEKNKVDDEKSVKTTNLADSKENKEKLAENSTKVEAASLKVAEKSPKVEAATSKIDETVKKSDQSATKIEQKTEKVEIVPKTPSNAKDDLNNVKVPCEYPEHENIEPSKASDPQKPNQLPQNVQKNFEFFEQKESDFEIFLRNLEKSRANTIDTCTKMAKTVTVDEETQKDFLQTIWKYCIQDVTLVNELVQLCQHISMDIENFKSSAEKFTQNRINSIFVIIKSTEVTEAIRTRIANAILFIGGLYSQNLIENDVFQKCIVTKITSLLNYKEVADLLAIVSVKRDENEDENLKTKAKILSLESLQQIKFKEVFSQIKDDLSVIVRKV